MPVVAVVGAREAEARALSVRTYAAGKLGAMPAEEVVARAAAAAAAKADFGGGARGGSRVGVTSGRGLPRRASSRGGRHLTLGGRPFL